MTGRARPETAGEAAMLIDCDSCAVRDLACQDCVVSVMLGMPARSSDQAAPSRESHGPVTRVELDGPERAALAVLAGHGLVPPLRLVPRRSSGPDELGVQPDRSAILDRAAGDRASGRTDDDGRAAEAG